MRILILAMLGLVAFGYHPKVVDVHKLLGGFILGWNFTTFDFKQCEEPSLADDWTYAMNEIKKTNFSYNADMYAAFTRILRPTVTTLFALEKCSKEQVDPVFEKIYAFSKNNTEMLKNMESIIREVQVVSQKAQRHFDVGNYTEAGNYTGILMRDILDPKPKPKWKK